ncbi:MAG: GNAT family N-acetyltransferase [Rhodospirillales bacterium]|nr:GNAT family N-acetyltransferase [Alphaproteobacteria bacterium]MCB9986051.1 GNAT family N-acetyltransferase [Rhodospirillales bacterium]USO07378.1 MAG: GNAT family N-acetyltransferase [Rhodospirillales bacterium]
MELVVPALPYVESCRAALARGWSPDNTRPEAAQEELARLDADPAAYAASKTDIEAKGAPVTLPDGSTVPRLPGYSKWMWDGEFCGSIGLRWQKGTEALPPHCLGHIGYSVVPWKQGRGYATKALCQILAEAAATGLRYVEITTSPENFASQTVIIKNGGKFVERFIEEPQFGSVAGLRYRISF